MSGVGVLDLAEDDTVPARLGLARIAAVVLAALVLAWPAAWNGYPLVFADSGTYLGQALIGYLGWDRPAFYSVFLLATHWRLTLWGPVIAQALIVAHLIALTLRVLGRGEPWLVPLAALPLAVGTALPWIVGQIMPDVFTGVLVLSVWLLGFRAAALTRKERGYLLVLLTGAVAVHQSHVPLVFGLALVTLALRWRGEGARGAARIAARLLVPGALAVAAIVTTNLVAHGRVSLSPFGSVFLAARVIYDGPGMQVLRRECPARGWQICGVLDRLPGDHNTFLWEPDQPVRAEFGGGKAWAPEAAEIVAETLRWHPGGVVLAALRNTAEQVALGFIGTGDGLFPWRGVPGPEPLIQRFFPAGEEAAYVASRQSAGTLLSQAQAFIPLHAAAAGLGVVVLGWMALRRRLSCAASALAVLVVAGALGNAAITGGLSGPAPRYQARLLWLVVLVPVAVAVTDRRRA